jgi:hypothetical protein
MLRFGGLPAVWADAPSDAARIDFLEAYAESYLTQEIRQEGLVKNLDSFSRFLEIASLVNAQVVNVAGVARDAGVARPTVQGFFGILVDTLIGVWLSAWRPRAKVKELPIRSSTSSTPARSVRWHGGSASRSQATSAEPCSKPGCCTSFALIRSAPAAVASSATGERLPGRRSISSGPEPRRVWASR